MENIKDLLDRGYTNKAAIALYDALYRLINTVPNVELTREEFDTLLPLVVEKMGKEKENEFLAKKTKEVGDDVGVFPSRAKVIITFAGPPSIKLPYTIEDYYSVGQNFKYKIPQIDGYTSDFTTIRGKMGREDVKVVVTYKKTPTKPEEPLFGVIRVKKDCLGSARGYIKSPDKIVAHAYISGTWYMDQFGQKDQENEKGPENMEPKGVWWPGVTIHGPQSMNESDFKKVKARFLNSNTGEWTDFKLGEAPKAKDASVYGSFTTPEPKPEPKPEPSEQECHIWVPITPYELAAPNGEDGFYHYLVQVDWNDDGFYEQNLDIAVQPNIQLWERAKWNQIWPPQAS